MTSIHFLNRLSCYSLEAHEPILIYLTVCFVPISSAYGIRFLLKNEQWMIVGFMFFMDPLIYFILSNYTTLYKVLLALCSLVE